MIMNKKYNNPENPKKDWFNDRASVLCGQQIYGDVILCKVSEGYFSENLRKF